MYGPPVGYHDISGRHVNVAAIATGRRPGRDIGSVGNRHISAGVDADVAKRVREAIRWYESRGARSVEIALANTRLSIAGARARGVCRHVFLPCGKTGEEILGSG